MRIGVFAALLAGGAFAASLANEATHEPALGASVETPALAAPPGAAALTKADDGHFYAEAMVRAGNSRGARVRFLVDTGASIVALTPADAQRVGVDLGALSFDARVRTANGESRGARVRLARVSVGDVEARDVDALVLPEGLPQSLLGMSYLGRLSHIEAAGDALILRR